MKAKSDLLFGVATVSSVGDERFDEILRVACKQGTVSGYLNDIFFAALMMARNSDYKLDQEHGLGDFIKTKVGQFDGFMVGLANLYGEIHLQYHEKPLVFVEDEETGKVIEVNLDDWMNQLRKEGRLVE